MVEKKIISQLYEEWLDKDNERHREDSPAISLYYTDGNIMRESYYLNGKRHREDGPALIQYNENGNIKSEKYYLNGKKITKIKFDSMKNKINIKSIFNK
jgi:antitoxin component YwqK of YwqJK toxin-antitoxin module